MSFSKEQLSYGWAYVFRHKTLGYLGRIVLQGRAVSGSRADATGEAAAARDEKGVWTAYTLTSHLSGVASDT